MGKLDLIVVVPVYNEAKILLNNLTKLNDYLKNLNIDFRIIITIDFSGDDSINIANNFVKQNKNAYCITHDKKMGRGYAVREAWKLFNANYYSFIDADLATGLNIIYVSYEYLVSNRANIVTASRYIQGGVVKRPPLRNAVSISYNRILRLLFNDGIFDHQCGFKIIDNTSKEKILDQTKEDSWFWDTELLVIAKKFNLRVTEIGVNWVETKYFKTPIRRLLSDIYIHGTGIVKLLSYLKSIPFDAGGGAQSSLNGNK